MFLVWNSLTGVRGKIGSVENPAALGKEASEARAKAATPAATTPGFTCPETMTSRPKPKPAGWNVGLLHHLHSGESFGPVGTIVSIMSGLALMFFSFSGLWLYIQMWRGRLARVERGKTVR